MPVLFVWNVFDPSKNRRQRAAPSSPPLREDLDVALRGAVLSVTELGPITSDDILIVYPTCAATPTDLTLVSVDVLFDRPHRTREARVKLAEALRNATLGCYARSDRSHGYRVEVAVRRFDDQADVYA